jgi:hypothetical protein
MNDVKVDWNVYARMQLPSGLSTVEYRDGTIEFYEGNECVATLTPAGAYLDEVMKEFHPDYIPPESPHEEPQEKQNLTDSEGNTYPF